MTTKGSETLLTLLLLAVVYLMVGVSSSGTKQCVDKIEKKATKNYVTIRNIGIRMCQVRCDETGGCLKVEFNHETLTCRIRLGESRQIKTNGGITVLENVPTGPCASMSCSLGCRCLETRSGNVICVKDEKFHHSRPKHHRRDKEKKQIIQDCKKGKVGGLQDQGDTNGAHRMTPVLFAAREGYKDVLDFCACAGGNMSVNDSYGNNILHLASLGGHVPMVKYIVSQNITDINSRGIFGRTPVLFAAAKGHTDVFVFLVSKGGEPSLVDTNNSSVLHLASYGGHLAMVKHILSQNIVEINGIEIYGRTHLMSAATGGNVDVFRSLMSEGSNASLVDRFGDNILHTASRGGHVDMVGYILSQNITDINSRGNFERTPVMLAAGAGHRDVFDLLANRGADVHLVDVKKSNILHVACFFGKVEMVKYIISKNIVDINSRGLRGRPVLMIAAEKGSVELVQFIVEKGGNMSLVDDHENNILHIACLAGHIEMVKHILREGAVGLEATNKYGWTPQMFAQKENKTELIHCLNSISGRG